MIRRLIILLLIVGFLFSQSIIDINSIGCDSEQRNIYIPQSLKKEAYSNYWHIDYKAPNTKYIRIMVYLTDQIKEESIHWIDKNITKKAINAGLYGR